MESNAEIVIVGAGISGLATALALHRLGLRSLVLESSEDLRASGFAIATFSNAWRALDALGIGDSLRQQHCRLLGVYSSSTVSGDVTSYVSFTSKGKYGENEVRCVKRNVFLETLAKELPSGTIRYSSKVVSVEKSGFSILVHLADGSILKAKVLIGCDGVNSVVAKSLGFTKAFLLGRFAIRGFAYYKEGHGFELKFQHLMGYGVRCGIIPCDNTTVYWFFIWSPSSQEKETLKDADQHMLKQFVLSKLGKVVDQVRVVIEDTSVDEIICTQLRFRSPWELLFGNISKDNVSIAGDACHPMTPDLGQGGCSSLEGGLILARCLAEALMNKSTCLKGENYEYEKIKMGLNNYAMKRRWRLFSVISIAYILGIIQESNNIGMRFLREKMLSAFFSRLFLKMADIDPAQLDLMFER